MWILNKIADIFQLDDQNWLKHSNPWSVYSRYSVLPILIIAIWSREWIWYYSLISILLSVLWAYYNPRFFSKPKTTKTWASRAVFWERVYLSHAATPIPDHHVSMLKIINSVMPIGVSFLVYGLWALSIWPTIIGTVIVIIWKTWFLDRMVWIYMDMKEGNKEYKSWDY
jgi:hypothetical protein